MCSDALTVCNCTHSEVVFACIFVVHCFKVSFVPVLLRIQAFVCLALHNPAVYYIFSLDFCPLHGHRKNAEGKLIKQWIRLFTEIEADCANFVSAED